MKNEARNRFQPCKRILAADLTFRTEQPASPPAGGFHSAGEDFTLHSKECFAMTDDALSSASMPEQSAATRRSGSPSPVRRSATDTGAARSVLASVAEFSEPDRNSSRQAVVGGIVVAASLAFALVIGWPSKPLEDYAKRKQPAQSAQDVRSKAPPVADLAPAASVLLATEPEASSAGTLSYEPALTEEPEAVPATPDIITSGPAVQNPSVPPPPKATVGSRPTVTSRTQRPRSQGPAPDRTEKQEATRNDEIRRLRSQAYSETARDRLGGDARTPAQSSANRRHGLQALFTSPSRPDLRHAISQCQRKDNLFEREKCKWQLCNGQWGQHGCPSYRKENSQFLY